MPKSSPTDAAARPMFPPASEVTSSSASSSEPEDPCPCGAGAYAACCGRFHAGAAPPTAEALMRSRYSAFARGDGEYLVATQAEPADAAALAAFGLGVRWLGLHVFDRTQGGAEHRAGTVAFVARFEQAGVERAIVELSTFDRVDGRPDGRADEHPGGRWRYLRGGRPRLGPTSRCPCGRGRAFGRCCGR